MLRILVLAILATPLTASGQEVSSASELLTVDQAVALALQNNREVKICLLSVNSAKEGVAATRTARLPQLKFDVFELQSLTHINFNVKEGQFGTFPGIGPVPATPTNISTPLRPITLMFGTAAQPLSQLYRIGLGIHEQEVGVDLAQESVRQERQNIASQAKRGYYQILQTQSALDAMEESTQFLRELDRVTDQYVAKQVVLKSESLTVKTKLAQTEYQTLMLQDSLAAQRETLNQLMGRDLRTEFRVQAVPEPTADEEDLNAARRKALDQRPELREARLKFQQTKLDERVEKSQFIPDVSLAFHYLSPFSVNFLPKNFAGVGLMLNWQPFDWGEKKHLLAEKAMAVRQASLNSEEIESKVLLDVDTSFRKFREVRTLLRVNQMSRETEQEKLRELMDKYKQKKVLLKEVLQQQAALAEANSQYQQAVLSFWTARADFEKALGEE